MNTLPNRTEEGHATIDYFRARILEQYSYPSWTQYETAIALWEKTGNDWQDRPGEKPAIEKFGDWCLANWKAKIDLTEYLSNEKTYVEYDPHRKHLYGKDLTDKWNEPTFFNRTKRGLDKAWLEIKKQFTDTTRMYDVIEIASNAGIRCHSYCAVD